MAAQKSTGQWIISALEIIVGVVLLIYGQPEGLGLILAGVATAAAIIFHPDTTAATDPTKSPSYGFGSFDNPVKGDTPITVTYSYLGHKLAPTWVQAFVSPRGQESSDFGKVLRAGGQGLSGLMVCGEGAVLGPEWIKINDEDLWTSFVNKSPNESPNGSRTLFTMQHRYIMTETVDVRKYSVNISVVGGKFHRTTGSFTTEGYRVGDVIFADGFNAAANNGDFTVLVVSTSDLTVQPATNTSLTAESTNANVRVGYKMGWTEVGAADLLGTGNGVQNIFSFPLPVTINDDHRIQFFTQNPNRTDAANFELDETTDFFPRAWLVSPTRMLVNTQQPYPNGTMLWMRYRKRITNGVAISKNSDGQVELKFGAAPASTMKIAASYNRSNFPGFKYEFRPGTRHQLSIPGFDSIRNSYLVGASLAYNVPEPRTTRDPVDDIVLLIDSGPGGMIQYDTQLGGSGPISAFFKIQLQLATPTGTNIYNTPQYLSDPSGKRGSKGPQEFEIWGETESQIFDAFSIRGLLKRFFDANPTSVTAKRMLDEFVRARYTVTVIRSNKELGQTDGSYVDEIVWTSMREEIYEFLNYSGSAMLGFHGLAGPKLNGNAPNITMKLKGRSDVEKWTGAGWVAAPENQSNRVWATIDLLTNRRFGCGDVYTKAANIDTTSALLAANFLDESVPKQSGSLDTEVRSRLDINLDVRRSPMEHVRTILSPGRVFAVLRGEVWHFVIDKEVTLKNSIGEDVVTVVYDDTKLGRTAKNTLQLTRDSIARSPSQVQVMFLDEDQNWDQKEVWTTVNDSNPGPLRIERAQGYGITRVTEINRYAKFLYTALRQSGPRLNVAIGPLALDWGAGKVFRIISERANVDGYWRVSKITFNTKDFFIQAECRPYDPLMYSQGGSPATILRPHVDRRPTPLAPYADDIVPMPIVAVRTH